MFERLLKRIFKNDFEKGISTRKDGPEPRIQDLEEKFIFERFLKRIVNKKRWAQATNPGFGGKVRL